ncbi:uncharacterized protein BYT42DRAFT_564002 [Radiomyces spectabilis]|uniref:uncharacterized protein n=1 Tax=Radiomyces spectabilis TaxID=64574 RepID=UPI00221EC7B5|nr:uncharacterized protein BYT42DRAFT_564002 [Radiomyces spectabilis]KAI8384901.1 hypothetical protein BYT42DRAFT_564002 [Radiomyces spectabilis]
MSVSVARRERKYNGLDNDRLQRAISQPVQAWEKKWASHSQGNSIHTFKWVKSTRPIVFEDEEDEGPEPVSDAVPAEPKVVNETHDVMQPKDSQASNNPTEDSIPAPMTTKTPTIEQVTELEVAEKRDQSDLNDAAQHPSLAPHVLADDTESMQPAEAMVSEEPLATMAGPTGATAVSSAEENSVQA